MIKMVDFVVRKDGTSHEEFADYWLNEHTAIAKEMPGVRKYVTSLPTSPEHADYDGVLELYFDDMAALKAAFDSAAGERTLADAATFIDLDAGPTMYVEETVQLDETGE